MCDEVWLRRRRERLVKTAAGRAELRAGMRERRDGWVERKVGGEKSQLRRVVAQPVVARPDEGCTTPPPPPPPPLSHSTHIRSALTTTPLQLPHDLTMASISPRPMCSEALQSAFKSFRAL